MIAVNRGMIGRTVEPGARARHYNDPINLEQAQPLQTATVAGVLDRVTALLRASIPAS